MKITEDHWLAPEPPAEPTVSRQLIKGGEVMRNRRLLIIHFTSGASGQSSVDFWRTPDARGASAHLVIERHGPIIQCRPFDRTCGHAGVSHWRDPRHDNELVSGLNSCSIGIELANAGKDKVRWATQQPGYQTVHLRHKNGEMGDWEVFPDPQLASLFIVAPAIVRRYNLDDIAGHDDVAPDRKNDPGPAFPMQKLREACGFSGLPVTFHG